MAPSSYYWTISFMYLVIPESRRCGVREEKNPREFFDFPNLTDIEWQGRIKKGFSDQLHPVRVNQLKILCDGHALVAQ